jgi:hypothetical protein
MFPRAGLPGTREKGAVQRSVPLLLLLGVISLTGCFNITHEVWLYGDGSGQVRIDLALSEVLVSEPDQQVFGSGIEEGLQGGAGSYANITNVSARSYAEDGFRHEEITYALVDITEPPIPPGADVPGNLFRFTVDRPDGGNARFSYTLLGAEEAGPVEGRSDFATALANSYYTFRLHTPDSRIVDTNGELSADGRTVTWQVPLAEWITASDGAVVREMHAEVDMSPTNWLLWSLIAAGLVALVTIVLVGVAASRRRSPAPAVLPEAV